MKYCGPSIVLILNEAGEKGSHHVDAELSGTPLLTRVTMEKSGKIITRFWFQRISPSSWEAHSILSLSCRHLSIGLLPLPLSSPAQEPILWARSINQHLVGMVLSNISSREAIGLRISHLSGNPTKWRLFRLLLSSILFTFSQSIKFPFRRGWFNLLLPIQLLWKAQSTFHLVDPCNVCCQFLFHRWGGFTYFSQAL